MLIFSIMGVVFLFNNKGLFFLYFVLLWALLASGMMMYWGFQARRKYKAAYTKNQNSVESGIGYKTLEMIGGVSAAVIASVTLVILFASSERAAKDALRTSCAQLTEAQRSDHPKAASTCSLADNN